MMCRTLLTPMIAALLVVSGCGNGEPEQGISLPPRNGGVTVSQALAGDSQAGWVRGFLLAERGHPVLLCEQLSATNPPQCESAALILRNGVIWREPYSSDHPYGGMTPGGQVSDGALATDQPCGYEAGGPCAELLGVAASGQVLWTEVAYSVIGTVRGSELHRLEAPPGGDL